MHIPKRVVCFVNQRVFLSSLCLLLLVSLVAVTVIAAEISEFLHEEWKKPA
jgi:hypothetical protein